MPVFTSRSLPTRDVYCKQNGAMVLQQTLRVKLVALLTQSLGSSLTRWGFWAVNASDAARPDSYVWSANSYSPGRRRRPGRTTGRLLVVSLKLNYTVPSPSPAAPATAWRPASRVDARHVSWDPTALTRHPKGVDCVAV